MGVFKEVRGVISPCEALLASLEHQSFSDHEYETINDLTQRIEKEAILHQFHYCAPALKRPTNLIAVRTRKSDHGSL